MNRYKDIKKIYNENSNVANLGVEYYKPVYYPEIEVTPQDIYIITEFGDRLDLLSFQFYNDVNLYWIISSANPDKINMGSLTITEGTQLRIPVDINSIIEDFNRLNKV